MGTGISMSSVNKIKELAAGLKTEKNRVLLQEVRQLDDDSFNATLAKLKNKEK